MVDESARSRKIAFIHINRTGGSTFRKVLQAMFGEDYHFSVDPTISGIAADAKRYQALEFHVVVTPDNMFMTHYELCRQDRWDLLEDSAVFVLFRDPVDQYLSRFHHSLQRRAYTEPAVKARGFQFPDTLEKFMAIPVTYNAQLSYLLGLKRDTGYCPTVADLDRAKEILSRPNFHPVLTERFADAIHILQHETGRSVPGKMVLNVNRNPDRPAMEAVPEDVLETIRRNSQLDYELYEFVRERFLADLERCGPATEFSFEEEAVPATQPHNVAIGNAPSGLISRLKGALGIGKR